MRKFLSLLVLILPCLCAMGQPPQPLQASWSSLPQDIKRYSLQFFPSSIASSNVPEVAETIRVLNAINKFFHATIQSEEFILKILDCMPYTANAVDLVKRLRSIPSMQTQVVLKLYNPWNVCLENGELLSAAAKANDVLFLRHMLANKKVDLNWPAFGHNTALMLAIQNKNIVAVRLLVAAGANPEAPHVSALYEAVRIESREIVELLLVAGADPNMLPDCDPTPEICELIIPAQEKRKERMRLLCGKKPEWCVIQ